MSDRISETVVLCEDDPQEQLVRSYLKRCSKDTPPPRVRNASREVHGGNVGWVIAEFPKELAACRRRNRVRAKTLLIVVVDADKFSVDERRSHFKCEPTIEQGDPLVLLIPRRHIETWIRAVTGETVNETDDYKKPDIKKERIRSAAGTIHGWARGNPAPVADCPPSLAASFPQWRTIG